jgi:uncharacterized Zn finger protein (UPF0148 family)
MWCDSCQRTVMGQKTTARARNTLAGLAALPSMGASLLGAKNEGYVCPNCGSRVKPKWRHDLNVAAEEAERQKATGSPTAAQPPLPNAESSVSTTPVGNRRPATGLVEQLAELDRLHTSGALSDGEFEQAKRRLLADG